MALCTSLSGRGASASLPYCLMVLCMASVCIAVFGESTMAGTPLSTKSALASASRAALPRGKPLLGIPLNALSATRERPVFSRSRRPPPPPPAPRPASVRPAPRAEPPPLKLLGTVIGGAVRIAIFQDNSSKKVVRLGIGQKYAGWLLEAVEAHATTFRQGHRTELLALPKPGAPRSPDEVRKGITRERMRTPHIDYARGG